MSAYNVAAIPTVYRGRQYRSRLEAKWAAFFDAIKWEFEYEPFDLGSWSPDFLLRGRDANVLVEIKPITSFDSAVATKMYNACVQRGLKDSGDTLLLLGTSPFRVGSGIVAGWEYQLVDVGASEVKFSPLMIRWLPDSEIPIVRPDLIISYELGGFPEDDSTGVWGAVFSGTFECEAKLPPAYPNHTLKIWSEATNAVQWKGEGRQP